MLLKLGLGMGFQGLMYCLLNSIDCLALKVLAVVKRPVELLITCSWFYVGRRRGKKRNCRRLL